jgi:short subunit dehydrogenase-like uncharacterized protein
VRHVVVLGGLGFFGRTAAAELRTLGVQVQTASRRPGADLCIDANNPESIRAAVKHANIVLDAAGPYYARTRALIETAIEVGFDVVDLNDDLSYAEMILRYETPIAEAGIRVLSSASTVSAFSAAVMKIIGPESPSRFTSFLAPATRLTANGGTAKSLLRTIGKPIRVLRQGTLQTIPGWREKRTFRFHSSQKMRPIHGHVFESADALWLPRIRPSLRDVEMYVDANTLGANAFLSLAARSNITRSLLQRTIGFGTSAARRFGSEVGGVAYELEGEGGRTARFAMIAEEKSYMLAIAPAVLAIQKLATDQITERGLILPDRYADPQQILGFLQSAGVKFVHSQNC